MNLSAWFIQRPVGTTLLSVAPTLTLGYSTCGSDDTGSRK